LQALQHIQDLAPKAQMQTLEAWKVGEHSHFTSGTSSLYDHAPSTMDVSITYALLRKPGTEVHRLRKCLLQALVQGRRIIQCNWSLFEHLLEYNAKV